MRRAIVSSSYSIPVSPWTSARWFSICVRVSRLIAMPSLKSVPSESTVTACVGALAGASAAPKPSSSSSLRPLRRGGEPAGQVHVAADHRRLDLARPGDEAREVGPPVMDRDAHLVPGPALLALAREGLLAEDRGAQRVQRVERIGPGRAPDDHHPVAEVLVHLAAETLDDRDEVVEDPVQLPRQVPLGDVALGRPREAAQVEEQDGGGHRVVQHLGGLAELVDPQPAPRLVLELLGLLGRERHDPVAHVRHDLEAAQGDRQLEEGVEHLRPAPPFGLGPQRGSGEQPRTGRPGIAEQVGEHGAAHHDAQQAARLQVVLAAEQRQVPAAAREQPPVALAQPAVRLAHQHLLDLEEGLRRDPVALVDGEEVREVEIGDRELGEREAVVDDRRHERGVLAGAGRLLAVAGPPALLVDAPVEGLQQRKERLLAAPQRGGAASRAHAGARPRHGCA